MIHRNVYRIFRAGTCALILNLMITEGYAAPAAAVKVDGKTWSLEDLVRENQGRFYPIEQKKFELINTIAQEKYFEAFFDKLAKAQKISPDQARHAYLEAKLQINEKELQETLAKFKDHPALKDKSESERKKAVSDFLKQGKVQEALGDILREATAKKQLQVLYPEPVEPVYPVSVAKNEPIRYGPNGQESAQACQGDDCTITVVEYSDFECPFCERAQNPTQEVLKAYQGKIRWVVRDFPLESHSRSRPAAIAAHCAKDQGKYWEMYTELFQSQRNLSDADLKKIAMKIGLDAKAYESCVNQPAKALAQIDAHLKTGEQLGVTGTPTYFVNGRRVSGALPFEEFKRVIELSQK